MKRTKSGWLRPGDLGWCAASLALSALVASCNLGFDANEFGPLGDDADVGVEIPEGCEDNDDDGFGFGTDCELGQIDCDDGRSAIHPGAEERCDSLDNDCDEIVDESVEGRPLEKDCYTSNPAELDAPATACRGGKVVCDRGAFPEPVTAEVCQGQILPRSPGEVEGEARCDGIDNDCDGVIDPECECPEEGLVDDQCYAAGPTDRGGLGICVFGQRTCQRTDDGELVWSECVGDVAPASETCANLGTDDDCDGELDNVPQLGEACESQAPGRCRPGHLECVNSEFGCVSNLEPVEEVCDGLDQDCDGENDNGVANVCGGCRNVGDAQIGDPCGVCEDGELACDVNLDLVCVGASGLNACNGCATLGQLPGDECGACGRVTCSGTEAVRCTDPGSNACGGCGPINGGEQLGRLCGGCGTFVCDGENDVICQERAQNACGGCAVLNGEPRAPCGPCGAGRLACQPDGESLRCDGDSVLNACGGCQVPPGALNSPCGDCGTLTCDEVNVGAFRCNDPGENACGGCGALPNPVGGSCGTCGTFLCQNGTTSCVDPGRNGCGGCATLPGAPGALCGQCGVFQCTGQDSVQCADPGRNACGGCATLQGAPNEACGTCGTFRCSVDPNRISCNDPGLNACGGCGPIVGPTVGSSCGVCGRFVCDGTNATRCEDPGLNVCGECGVLANTPGAPCGGNCGAFRCITGSAPLCDNRACVSPAITFRLQHYIPGGPVFDVLIDNLLPINTAGYEFRTIYINGPPGGHNIKVWLQGSNQSLDPPIFNENINGLPGEELTVLFAGLPGEPGVNYDMYVLRDDNAAVPNQAKFRFVNTLADQPLVDVYVDGILKAQNVPLGGASPYINISALPARRISVATAGTPFPFASFNLIQPLLGGSVYSLIHFGRIDSAQFPQFPQLLRSERDRELQILTP